MKLTVLKEAGYDEAALGFSLSYNSTIERAKQLLPKYAFGKSGERKFLESIFLWLDVDAPRFWWSEADTYRMSTKQSESTMHTLTKVELTQNDFELPIDQEFLSFYNNWIFNGKIAIDELKNALPEGFLQRRIWVLNYRVLQNIYEQRHNHRLPQWRYFCEEIQREIEHPEFIVNRSTNEQL